jgi:hypothetical protein
LREFDPIFFAVAKKEVLGSIFQGSF